MFKKVMLVAIIAFFLAGMVYAAEKADSELLVKEAGNYYKEGVSKQKSDDFEGANVAYQKILLLDPNNKDYQKYILNNTGLMYTKQGDLDKAEAYFNQALAIDPNYHNAQLNLGLIYDAKEKNRLTVIQYWLKVLNIDLDKLKPKGYILEEPKEED